jgi:hypothetical protein
MSPETVLRGLKQIRARWIILCIAVLVAVVSLLVVPRPSFLRPTTSVHIRVPVAPGVSSGTPVKRFGLAVGYVHKIELDDDATGAVIELAVVDDASMPPISKTDIAVIHRLHRYDDATIYIERDATRAHQLSKRSEPLDAPYELPCVIANGPWPKLPQLSLQTEN